MGEQQAPPPSRQLFVRFPSRLPRSSREIEDIFAREGQVKHLKLPNSREHAFVHYWRTTEAIEAKKRLDGTTPFGIALSVDFNRSSRLLRLDCPSSFVSAEQIIAIMQDTFPRYEWIDFVPDKKLVYVFMTSVEDAIESVRKLQMTLIGEWRLEIDFHKESSYKASRHATTRTTSHHATVAAPVAATTTAASPPPPAPAAATVSLAASVEEKNEDRSPKKRDRSRSPSPKRSRGRSPHRRSRSRSPSRSPSPSFSSSRSRSPSPSPPRHSSSKKKRKEKEATLEEKKKRKKEKKEKKKDKKEKKKDDSRRSSSSSRHCHRSASPPSSPSFSSVSEDSSSSSSSSNSTLFPYACSQCNKLFDHLHADHKLSEDYVTKKLVKAWFHGNFKLIRGDGGHYKTSLSIRRQPFLKGYINPFLRSVGLPEWSSRSPTYADWFLGRVLRLAPEQLNSTLPWRFHRFTTRENFEEILRKLLDHKE